MVPAVVCMNASKHGANWVRFPHRSAKYSRARPKSPILTLSVCGSVSSTFSGFKSRCTMLWLWRWFKALASCVIHFTFVCSPLGRESRSFRFPPAQNSVKIRTWTLRTVVYRTAPTIVRILSWCTRRSVWTSRIASWMAEVFWQWTSLRANGCPLSAFRTLYTTPKAPLPSSFSTNKCCPEKFNCWPLAKAASMSRCLLANSRKTKVETWLSEGVGPSLLQDILFDDTTTTTITTNYTNNNNR